MENLIEVKNLSKSYTDKCLFENINFELKLGENLFITGTNGAGKSTLVNILLGFINPDSGSVKIHPEYKKSEFGLVFQDNSVDQYLTVKDFLKLSKIINYKKKENKKILELIDKNLMKKRLNRLSGGEKQKIKIAAGLLHSPKVLITDEVTSGLDAYSRDEIADMIHDYVNTPNVSYISVSHYEEEINRFADKVLILNNGKITLKDNKNKDFTFYEKGEQHA
ncbi:ATP-binding cassette domain-containing protein [Priestia aryabhattai]